MSVLVTEIHSHINIKIGPVISLDWRSYIRASGNSSCTWQQCCCPSSCKRRNKMAAPDHVRWIQESESKVVRRRYKTNLWKTAPMKPMVVVQLTSKPPHPKEFHAANLSSILNLRMCSINFRMIDTMTRAYQNCSYISLVSLNWLGGGAPTMISGQVVR